MKHLIYALMFAVALPLFFTQCTEDETDDEDSKGIDTTITIDATSKSKWTYFSFEKGMVVTPADSSNSKEWDLAFKRYLIKSNSGKSGIGSAGVYSTNMSGEKAYNGLTEFGDTVSFSIDDTVIIEGYNPANPTVPTQEKHILNPVLNNKSTLWYNLEQGPASTLTSKEIVYIVKTANGKFAKLYILSYYNEEDKAGFIKIKYTYQPDGSKKFE